MVSISLHTRFYCVMLILAGILGSAIADNPIISHKYTADPSALVYGGRVYVYCSRDDNNNNGYSIVDYTLVSSDDMINWTDHGEVFHAKKNTTWANLAYAPSCVEREGKFYLYFPDGGSSIGVAVADRPDGPFKDPLGKSLVNKSMPNCDVEWCFDPCAFVDDDGQAYLYFGGGSSGVGTNLRGIKLNKDMISTTGTAVTISAPSSFEAAYMHKYNNTYYFSYSTNGAAKIDYQMSDNPLSGFSHKGTVLGNPTLNGTNINRNNNNHASIVKFNDVWYMFYHDRRLSNEVYFRNVCVDLLTYNTDGTLKPVTVTEASVPQIKNLNPYDTVQAETINRQSGIKTSNNSEGAVVVSSISEGDFTNISSVDFGTGAKKFEIMAASGSSGGTIELRLGGKNGSLVGTCTIAGTGNWTTWKTFSCEVTGCSGVKDLYLVYQGSGEPFRLDWYRFTGTTTSVKKRQSLKGAMLRSRACSIIGLRNGSKVSYTAKAYDLSGRIATRPGRNYLQGSAEGIRVFNRHDL